MKRRIAYWIGSVCLAAACQAEAPGAPAAPIAPPAASAALTPAASPGSVATSVDARGVPTFLWATAHEPPPPGATPALAARHHLARHVAALGASVDALPTVELASLRDMGASGVVAELKQRAGGVEIIGGSVRLLMKSDLTLVALTGALHSARLPRGGWRRSEPEALAGALTHLLGHEISPRQLIEQPRSDGDEHLRFQIADFGPVALPEPARVRRVYFPDAAGLVAAYFIEFYAGERGAADTAAWRYIVAADDGRVLSRRDLTSYDSFNYRVWADGPDHRPSDGPHQDFTPSPSGKPDGVLPAFTAPSLIAIEGFNHNPMGVADPWLAPADTQTLGNNVDAYVDLVQPDGLSMGDYRATTTTSHAFDRVYDPTVGAKANQTQAMAGVTQLFYDVNWLHDYYYDSGFDEAGGNAQASNFTRGGMGNDRMHAEAQDYSGTNNSNMSTPSDGMSPRMQVFIWTGKATTKLTTAPGGDVSASSAGFGPGNYNVSGTVVLVDTGKPSPTDGCNPIVNAVTGKVALIDRGNCTFKQKVVNAQAAGAIAVLIADNQAGNAPPQIADGLPATPVTIPSQGITQAAGNTIKAALGNGAVTATLLQQAAVDRDGTLDNTVVAHEWGHYLHHRLADCGAPQCSALSEGWGDFTALMMELREGDNLDGTFAMAIYDSMNDPNAAYWGLRRQPYSVDFTKNALTLKHISDGQALPMVPSQASRAPNSEVHNAGEIWATMMFEGYVALLERGRAAMPPVSFDAMRRRMTDYVVTGLKLTPAEATFTEQRDAILAAAAARDKDDLATLAAAFARRGAGTCAVAPARDSRNFAGVVEDFGLKTRLSLGAIMLDDSLRSCDHDGVLDADEIGQLTIVVSNAGPIPMVGATVSVASPTGGLGFPGGALLQLPDIAPYASTTAVFQVSLDKSWIKAGTIELDISATSMGSCEGTVMRTLQLRANYDELPATSASDDVEARVSPWKPTGDLSDKIWSRPEVMAPNHAWRGLDWGSPSDTALESPDLVVSAMDPFTFEMDHRYQFEAATEMGVRVYYDAGVIEISSDGGMTWTDLAKFTKTGYGGTVTDVSGNSLAKQQALVDQSPSWPADDHVSFDLGNAMAGKTVRVRFRIGTDQASSAFGWEIDNVQFHGITNKPFATVVDNTGMCPTLDMSVPPDLAPAVMARADLAAAAVVADLGMAADPPPLATDGCGCTVGRREPVGTSWALVSLGVAIMLRRRSRPRRAVTRRR